MKIILASIVAMAVIAVSAQLLLTHYVGESSDYAYHDQSTRPD